MQVMQIILQGLTLCLALHVTVIILIMIVCYIIAYQLYLKLISFFSEFTIN